MTEHADCVVVGAGVVGLAVARALATAGRDVLVLEVAGAIGTGTSSRSSEVIHAGLYYPRGSLKARLCVTGREQLYRYCAERGVAHARLGKLVVATCDDERPALDGIRRRAVANGVADLRELDAAQVRDLEPEVVAVAGLLSPSTGIVDSAALMRALRRDAAEAGADVIVRSEVAGGRVGGRLPVVEVAGAGTLAARWLINAAGLGAWSVARGLRGLPATAIPPRFLAKGDYFQLARGGTGFRHLVYPVPGDGGLGVHLTLDLDGRARFGPDVEWLGAHTDAHAPRTEPDYTVDPAKAASFRAAISRYWPAVADRELVPAYAGVRPKVAGAGAAGDFVIAEPADHGVPGLINLFGIESPGLTSSLAIGDLVQRMIGQDRGSRPADG